MDADFYLLLLFATLFVFSLVGLGLALLVPGSDAPDRPAAVRRTEPAAALMVRAPCCRYRTQTARREHSYDLAEGQRNRMKKI
jgi:hypothetical protein